MPTTLDAVALKQLCKECDGYATPQLNDKIYGNFRGYSSICSEALGRYTGIKSLILEGNALETLEDMPQLDQLVCLYVKVYGCESNPMTINNILTIITCYRFVQRNAISSLSGLQMLRNLVTLNVSNNRVTTLKGLEACAQLTTLNASHNQLTDADSLHALTACPLLTTVDVQCNQVCG